MEFWVVFQDLKSEFLINSSRAFNVNFVRFFKGLLVFLRILRPLIVDFLEIVQGHLKLDFLDIFKGSSNVNFEKKLQGPLSEFPVFFMTILILSNFECL